MKAKEMFEELGYLQTENNNINIVYTTPHNFNVIFRKYSETYVYYVELENGEVIYCNIDAKLHLAIHQQMKELWWI